MLPIFSTLLLPEQEVAAEIAENSTFNPTAASPTLNITDVSVTPLAELEVDVKVTLQGYNYDFFVRQIRMYLNQSARRIVKYAY